MGRRGFGMVRRLPSKRYQASYAGPDLGRHTAPNTFTTKGDAEAWLAEERKQVESGKWRPPAVGRRKRPVPSRAKPSPSTPPAGSPSAG